MFVSFSKLNLAERLFGRNFLACAVKSLSGFSQKFLIKTSEILR